MSLEESGKYDRQEVHDPTFVLFTQLHQMSARPGGVGDLASLVDHLAQVDYAAATFAPLRDFNERHHIASFEAACEEVELVSPSGVPVRLIYNDQGDDVHDEVEATLVALTETYPGHPGAFRGLAVTDFGEGPLIVDVALNADGNGYVFFEPNV